MSENTQQNLSGLFAQMVKDGTLTIEQAKSMAFAADNAETVNAVAEGRASQLTKIEVLAPADIVDRQGKKRHYGARLAITPGGESEAGYPHRRTYVSLVLLAAIADNLEECKAGAVKAVALDAEWKAGKRADLS